ncbi:MAG: hypothetical protein KVP17_002151 [Porospora cf. gigantea B]|uniref:uncharacterized protein n=1 Tax=Porospora cf. gigantea B TaxID=2853592 RepID=UPI00357194D2|nr:MAG: hypothetical protein KVP17_002151 [Porospora cf. gigantea B]
MRSVTLLGGLALAAKSGNPYFYLQEGAEKCFSETLGVKTPLVVAYSTDVDSTGIDCQIAIRSPQGVVVALRSVVPTEPKGSLAVVGDEPGAYWICASCRNSHWMGSSSVKWNMHVDFPDSAISQPENIAKGSTMKNINTNLLKSQNHIERIVTYEYYQRSSDKGMHQVISGLRKTILLSNIFVTAAVTGGVLYGSRYLLSFFKRAKVV